MGVFVPIWGTFVVDGLGCYFKSFSWACPHPNACTYLFIYFIYTHSSLYVCMYIYIYIYVAFFVCLFVCSGYYLFTSMLFMFFWVLHCCGRVTQRAVSLGCSPGVLPLTVLSRDAVLELL